MRAEKIYEGATYRRRDKFTPIVIVTRIDPTHVHWRSQTDMSIGCAPIESFANDVTERVFPDEPQVDDLIELLDRMDKTQRDDVLNYLLEK